MAASTGIVLAATGIVVANEWYSTDIIAWRPAIAGVVLSAFLGGAEKIPNAKPIAVGLASVMLVTVLVTPFHGSSPLGTVSGIFNTPPGKRPAARKA
jgi:hypothetical protein